MKETQVTVPHLFTCPISLDLFTDPVTLSTGHTYERSSIERWLAAGNSTCPVTMQKLHDLSLVPNRNLRHLIHLWQRMDQQHLDGGHHLVKPVDPLAALKLTLESSKASLENKVQTLQRIQALINESPSTSSSFLKIGLLPLLFQLLFRHSEAKMSEKCYLRFAEEALSCALSLLPLCELGFLNMIKGGPEMDSFLLLFELGSSVVKKSLCLLVEAISSCSGTKEVCSILGQNRRFLKGLVHLIQQNDETSDAGIRAISGLCGLRSNVENLVREGAIDGLIAYISNHEKRRITVSVVMATLEQLVGLKSGQDSILMNPDGVGALVKMVFRVSDHEGSESAINLLMIICNESREAREKAIAVGVLTQLLLLLQSQCNGKAKTKARMLLKLLRSK